MSGRKEVAYGLGAYAAYLAVRRLVWTDAGRRRALANADHLLAWELRAGIDLETTLQQRALRAPRLLGVLNAGYAAGNVALSVGWLLWLHHRRDPRFQRERRAALIAFCGALPFFAALPTAPPRQLHGFVDTLAEQGFDLDDPRL